MICSRQLLDVLPDRRPRLRVEPDGRLVEEQHPRRVHQPACDLQAALHAAGEVLHLVATALPQADHLEHLPHPRLDRVAWDAVELGVEAEVELRREVGVERRVLEHEADVAADLRPLAHDVVAGDPRLAARRGDEGAEDLDGGRLAGPVRAEEPEGLASSTVRSTPSTASDLESAGPDPPPAYPKWNRPRPPPLACSSMPTNRPDPRRALRGAVEDPEVRELGGRGPRERWCRSARG